MLIIPAIDLKDGQVVRLKKGDFNTVQQVADDPVATAKAFYEAGARYLHVVDLDGSKDGVRKNSELVKAVAQVGLKTELGGGIRSMEDLEEVFALGIWRAIIGSAAVSDPDFVKAALDTGRSASWWALTPRRAWSGPPAGWRRAARTIWTLPSGWRKWGSRTSSLPTSTPMACRPAPPSPG